MSGGRRLPVLTVVLGLGAAAWPPPVVAAECDSSRARSSVSFSRTIEPMLKAGCAFPDCHQPTNPAQELVLDTGYAYMSMVGLWSVEVTTMKVVEPGDPENSYLIHKLRGTHIDAGGVGERMPFDLPPLSDDVISAIVTWIADCSPRN